MTLNPHDGNSDVLETTRTEKETKNNRRRKITLKEMNFRCFLFLR